MVAKEGGRSSTKLDQGWQVWKRPLHDGSKAALLLNRKQHFIRGARPLELRNLRSFALTRGRSLRAGGDTAQDITADFSDLGISGSAAVRDVWQRKDLGTVSGKYTATVPPHGSLTLKLTAQAAEDGTVRACDAVAPAESGGPLYERQYVQVNEELC